MFITYFSSSIFHHIYICKKNHSIRCLLRGTQFDLPAGAAKQAALLVRLVPYQNYP